MQIMIDGLEIAVLETLSNFGADVF